jgi:2-oxoglutarate dehydrogenase E1 component
MKKEYDAVFGEFEGKGIADSVFDGDVKYHMGFSSDIISSSGNNVHLSLVPNPSHLEAVDPVVVGIARAKMDKNYGGDHNKICPILIHGDASLAGQGVIYELIQMSRLPGYEVGGTIHIVINNQIGFTTNPSDSRSSTYCTDIGKVTHSPIFHVNGDDVEALVHVTKLALAFRQRFHRDVFIDIISYRKYGHNEGDEPRFTQPKMYAAIDKHRDPFYIYSQKLLQENTITAEELKSFENELDEHLNSELQQAKSTHEYEIDVNLKRNWAGITFYDNEKVEPNPITSVSRELLFQVAEAISKIPATFHPHKKVAEVIHNRAEQVFKTNKIDWGNAEHLALGTLLLENIPVRISGQDVERGTFSHRHAVLIDQEDESKYIPLNQLAPDQPAKLSIYNSLLSEYAVMGFEFGYASAFPNALTIWEAQYGDFFNGAQIIVDQFLTSSKTKWQRMNGLVLLLPHGYEGGGPEHSSARIERFVQQCAQNNMYVCNFTEPANYFHALRRQVLTPYRRPLVVFTPKSLLRHKDCFSTVEDFTQGSYKEVLDDPTAKPADIKRVIFTSGKLYYDLYRYQRELALKEVAIIRIEQYYPFPEAQLSELIKKYKKAKEFIWAQEEPENMGLWNYLLYRWHEMAGKLQVVSRKEASSTATGSMRQHISQQQFIIKKSLNLPVETEIRI